ncbi:MAG: ribulokinase [Planctomycetia bacterium]|nr:ribulokinase [Planctomycetia bacterium]
MSIVAGVDFGTLSVRVSIVDSERGTLGSGTASYPLLRRADDPDHASQRHADHMNALTDAMGRAVASSGLEGRLVEALAVATTGSTVVPVGAGLVPLDDYYLWCDHRGSREAAEITEAAREAGLEAIRWSGGTYLAEFGLSKLLHWLRTNPDLRPRFVTALEHCDMVAAVLCGIDDPLEVPRSACAMGHKWMWNESLGGLPGDDFLTAVDPLLAGVRDKMGGHYGRSDRLAGTLSPEWARRLGLRPGIPIPVGALDAHWDAIGAGIGLGDVVNVIGTTGIEAGLSAAGDLFDAIARRARTTPAELFAAIDGYRSGQTGLLRLPWDHGDRTILGDPHLRGVSFGWGLALTAADELFAAVEGTAFHTRIILERIAGHGVSVRRVINAGGIPRKSAVLNRVYANALGTPILVPRGDATSLGSAIFAFLAVGTFRTVEEAQHALCPPHMTIEPDARGTAACEELFDHFRSLYLSLGREDSAPVPLGGLLPVLRKVADAAKRDQGPSLAPET